MVNVQSMIQNLFQSETVINEIDSPSIDVVIMVAFNIYTNEKKLDNRWVVPYNMTFIKKYQVHINEEWYNRTVMKYLLKM